MNEQTYKIQDNGVGLVHLIKREANIILASLDDKDEYIINKSHFDDVIKVAESIDNTEPQSDKDIDYIITTILKICNTGLLSSLTLKDDEFEFNNSTNCYINKRYKDIYKKDDIVYNHNAYCCTIRACYDQYTNSQIEFDSNKIYHNPRVYISKGGVLTGEYIDDCIIRPNIVEQHSFSIQSIVNIPVSRINDGNIIIFAVDHREPKLKALQEFYSVPVKIDTAIKGRYNIRNYTKLYK